MAGVPHIITSCCMRMRNAHKCICQVKFVNCAYMYLPGKWCQFFSETEMALPENLFPILQCCQGSFWANGRRLIFYSHFSFKNLDFGQSYSSVPLIQNHYDIMTLHVDRSSSFTQGTLYRMSLCLKLIITNFYKPEKLNHEFGGN